MRVAFNNYCAYEQQIKHTYNHAYRCAQQNETTTGNNNVMLKIFILTPPEDYSKYIVLTEKKNTAHITIIEI